MAAYIDLHIHTNHSDGTAGADEVLEFIREQGLVAFAVTDHDTLDGYREMKTLLNETDPELVSGVELSTELEGEDIHILAYFIDPEHPELNETLDRFRERRNQRGQEIVEKLKQLGMDIHFDDVLETSKTAVVGRPHIAETLERLGQIGNYYEAFRKYIGLDGPAYVAKERLSPSDSIALIHRAGGVAILAHPLIGDAIKHLDELVRHGLDGLEQYHYSASGADLKRLRKAAEKHGLIMSGGSDFHGRGGRNGVIGSQPVPPAYLESIRTKAKQQRGIH